MAVPKRKTSKSRSASRKAQNTKKPIAKASGCSKCGAAKEPHRVCPSCGYYKDRQVLTVSSDE